MEIDFFFSSIIQVWDSELEMLAQKSLLSCESKGNQCRRTKRHKFVGQNVEFVRKQPKMQPGDAMNAAMELWWNENKNITFIQEDNNYSSIRAKSRSAEFRRFAQMGRDKAYAIGCAVIETRKGFYITCNYAVENMDNHAVYTRGDLRSKCKINSIKYEGLCSVDENYLNFEQHDTRAYFKIGSETALPVKQWKANGRSLFGNKYGNADTKPATKAAPKPVPKPTPKPLQPANLQARATATVTGTSNARPQINIRYNGQQDMFGLNPLGNGVTRQITTSSTRNFPFSDPFQRVQRTNANDFHDIFGKFGSNMPGSRNMQMTRQIVVR